jgi:pimeloyl-ACP methyl ester carboxylesterase
MPSAVLRKALIILAALGVAAALIMIFFPRERGPIGIVFLHGKLAPIGEGPGAARQLIGRLRGDGYLVAVPEMCWSRRRGFDHAYPECLAEIDGVIADLKSRGASRVVIGGISSGATAAIAYAVAHSELRGVFALSPADDPERKARTPAFAASLDQARDLVAQGHGEEMSSFADVNTTTGGPFEVTLATTPRIFLSFYGPDAPTHLPMTVAKLRAPLLWISGDRDPTQRGIRGYAFDKAPPNPLNRFVTVEANHIGVLDAGGDAVLDWLAALKAR